MLGGTFMDDAPETKNDYFVRESAHRRKIVHHENNTRSACSHRSDEIDKLGCLLDPKRCSCSSTQISLTCSARDRAIAMDCH